jgi:hypothetical protein
MRYGAVICTNVHVAGLHVSGHLSIRTNGNALIGVRAASCLVRKRLLASQDLPATLHYLHPVQRRQELCHVINTLEGDELHESPVNIFKGIAPLQWNGVSCICIS